MKGGESESHQGELQKTKRKEKKGRKAKIHNTSGGGCAGNKILNANSNEKKKRDEKIPMGRQKIQERRQGRNK